MNYPTMDALIGELSKCHTKEKAEKILQLAKEDTPHAEDNIGYLIGYFPKPDAERLYKLFPTCNHPIFGPEFGRGFWPSPEESIQAGMDYASHKEDA